MQYQKNEWIHRGILMSRKLNKFPTHQLKRVWGLPAEQAGIAGHPSRDYSGGMRRIGVSPSAIGAKPLQKMVPNEVKTILIWAWLGGLFLFTQGLVPQTEAQEIRFEVEVSANRVEVGSALQLTLTVHGAKVDGPLQLPQIEGLDVRYLGPSTRISIINGRYSQANSFIYTLFPLKTGTFQIPAFSINIDGKTYTSEPITIEVYSPSAASSSQASGTGHGMNLQNRLFLSMGTPKEEVYLYEKVPLNIKLYIADIQVEDLQFPEFEHAGLTVEEFQLGKQKEQIKEYTEHWNGVNYHVVDFETYVYPTRTGELTMGPAEVTLNILVKRDRQRRSLFDGILGDDLLEDFFGIQEKYPYAVTSQPLTLHVRPLPEKDQPADYSGAVGNFKMDVSVGPKEVKVGDPLTLKVHIQGDGNMKALTIPTFKEDEQFKVYDPQVKEERDEKVLEQVLIPKNEKVGEVPAVRFSYFDPHLEEYKTLVQGPFPLKVAPLEKEEGLAVVGLGKPLRSLAPEILGRDIIFIKDHPGTFRPLHQVLYQQFPFQALAGGSWAIWLILFWGYRRSERLKTDVHYARRLMAPRKAKAGLAQARQLLTQGVPQEFYNYLFKTLQVYLEDKFHVASGDIIWPGVAEKLNNQSISPEILKKLKEILEECDMVRFAGIARDQRQKEESHRKLAEFIDRCERQAR